MHVCTRKVGGARHTNSSCTMKFAISLVQLMVNLHLVDICSPELSYISLSSTAGVSTRSLLRSDDGGSRISSAVNFPFYNNIITSPAFISVNGLISFGEEVRLSPQTSGNLFPDDTNTSHVVAPFWSNNDIRRDGEVNYEVHDGRSAESAAVVDQVSEAIVNQTGRDFRGTWMLVVEWRDCHPHPHGQSGLPLNSYLQQTNTYQAIAITDEAEKSFAFFIYECGGIEWGGESAGGAIFARVGVSVGGDIIRHHPLSGNESVDQIDCLNDPGSRWVNLVYDISLIRPSVSSMGLHSIRSTPTYTPDHLSSRTPSRVISSTAATSSSVSPSLPQPTAQASNHPTNTTELESSDATTIAAQVIAVAVVASLVAMTVVLVAGVTLLVLFKEHQKSKVKVAAQDILLIVQTATN